MKRTINFSARRRIENDDFFVEFVETDSGTSFQRVHLEWDLEAMGLPEDSLLVFECSGQGQFYRESLGHLAGGLGEADIDLGSVRDVTAIRAEIFVTQVSDGLPRIIASSAPVTLIVGEDTTAAEKSILPLRVMPELGCLFRVNYLSGTPVLEISGRSGAPQFEPWFAAAVLPSVLKEIYVSICLGLNQMEDSVLSQWVTFFTNAGFSPEFAMGADPLIAETLSKVFENAEDLGIWFSIHNNLLAGEVSSGS